MTIRITKSEASKLASKLEGELVLAAASLAELSAWQLRRSGDRMRQMARQADRVCQLYRRACRGAK